MRRPSVAFVVVLLGALSACTGAKVSAPPALARLPEKIESIALAPSGGVMADAIGTELFARGFRIFDTRETSSFLLRQNLDEIEILGPKSLAAMREKGITTVLSVKAVGGYDGKPQSATARVVSTKTGELVAAVNWQNGRGGAQGSPADAMMRKDLVTAAQQIVGSLQVQLRRPVAPE